MQIKRTIDPLKNWRMLVYAPRKTGKTILAMTASELGFNPESPPKEKTELSDLLVMNYDENGMDSLQNFNITAPHLDMFVYSPKQLMEGKLAQAQQTVEKEVKAGRCKTLVIDTLTSFDGMMAQYYLGDDGDLRKYNPIKAQHMKHGVWLKTLDCNVLMLCHTHLLIDMEDKKDANNTQKIKKEAERMPGQPVVVPDLTGRGSGVYKNGSYQIPLLAKKVGNVTKRFLYPNGIPGYEAGTRFLGFKDKEPANIQQMLQQVAAHNKGE